MKGLTFLIIFTLFMGLGMSQSYSAQHSKSPPGITKVEITKLFQSAPQFTLQNDYASPVKAQWVYTQEYPGIVTDVGYTEPSKSYTYICALKIQTVYHAYPVPLYALNKTINQAWYHYRN